MLDIMFRAGVTIGFDPDVYSVVEGDGQVTVTVRLLRGTLETTVFVNLHTSGATATGNNVLHSLINKQKHNCTVCHIIWEHMYVYCLA